jgi:hypothetical protein
MLEKQGDVKNKAPAQKISDNKLPGWRVKPE